MLALYFECACPRLRPVPAGARILRRMIASRYGMRYGCNARPPWRQPGAGDPGRTRGVAVRFLRIRSFLCMLHMESLE